MMRMNQSVRFCSSAAAASGLAFTAASLTGELPHVLTRTFLVEIIGELRNVLGEAERVHAHKIFGALGVARLERFDDGHVVLDRPVGAVHFADRRAADQAEVHEQESGGS